MSAVWKAARRLRIPATVRNALAGRTAAQDLGESATLGDWRDIADGRAPRFGPRELIGSGVTRPGMWRDVDPLRTPALPRKEVVLGVAIWASVTGIAGWRAWKRHGGVSGAREELRRAAEG